MEQAIWVDHLLSDMLAHYFCEEKEKRALLFSEVITGVDFRFSTRISLLFSILEIRHPELSKKYGVLQDRLDKLRRFRNRLAHSHLKATAEEIKNVHKGAVTFCFYEDGETKEQVVSRDELKKRLAESSDLLDQLLQIRAALLPGYDNK